eukprot:TRINITY_DN763_c0_g1_i1.p1 TRINITY_DN763_c0_g1~~TRINITY_DN763_c0_g1_i1.p1  ORF type:complete len:368 (+),score=50.41 TRINITY_DN763_c0_g1_i1:86-1189(+)
MITRRLHTHTVGVLFVLLSWVCMFVKSEGNNTDTEPTECGNVNGDLFFNRCFYKPSNTFLMLMANNIVQWVNPRTLAITTLSMCLCLPALLILNNHSSWYFEVRRKFHATRLVLIHFLYRISYSLVLDVALYAVFRQRRPCACMTNYSRYGMPSGDAMAAGILGGYLLDKAPFFKWATRFMGLLLIASVCFERVILGYHSVGQVMAGASIGVILHFYATRVPQYFLFLDAIIQWILGAVMLHIDKSLVYTPNDSNNLWAWFLWGVSFQIFALLMLLKHFKQGNGGRRMLRYNVYSMDSSALVPSEIDHLLLNSEMQSQSQRRSESEDRKLLQDSDIIFMLVCLVFLLGINFVSQLSQYYGWLVTTTS